MGHQSFLYAKTNANVYQTNGYSGSDADVDDTERFTADMSLEVNRGVGIDFKYDGSDATDDLILTLYKRIDSTWLGSEVAWKAAITVENDGAEHVYHYTIPNNYQPGHYRFGMKSAGGTSTFEMDANVRTWRVTRSVA